MVSPRHRSTLTGRRRSPWAEQNGEAGIPADIPLTSRLSILLATISIGHDSLRFVAADGGSDTAR
jgi:hypothetical protein